MLRFYKYFYFSVYKWNTTKWGESDVPEWKALIITTFMMLLNISFFLIVFDMLGWYSFIRNETPKVEIAAAYLFMIAYNYFQFVAHGKFKRIAQEYENECVNSQRKRKKIIWAYVIISFVLPFGLIIVQYELSTR
jgi:uncharacterized membrane-anchored protein YitT (DUF2179 family)